MSLRNPKTCRESIDILQGGTGQKSQRKRVSAEESDSAKVTESVALGKTDPHVEKHAAAFWKNVRKVACWEWVGGHTDGYGRFAPAYRASFRAHRFSWMLHNGPIPDGLCVLHRCDNRSCVKPDHLFLGTNRDNYHDSRSKGRHAKGEKHGNSKLTETDVRRIRKLADTVTTAQLARDFEVSEGAIYNVIHRNWRHVK